MISIHLNSECRTVDRIYQKASFDVCVYVCVYVCVCEYILDFMFAM